jgi:hypothetical protein
MAQTEELKTTRENQTSKQNARLFDFGKSLFSVAPRFERKKTLLLAARGFREVRAILSDEE